MSKDIIQFGVASFCVLSVFCIIPCIPRVEDEAWSGTVAEKPVGDLDSCGSLTFGATSVRSQLE